MENTKFVKEMEEGKSCVLDVLAVLNDGTKTNVEIQLLSDFSDKSCYPNKNIIRVDFCKDNWGKELGENYSDNKIK